MAPVRLGSSREVWLGFSWRKDSERHTGVGVPVSAAEGTPVSAWLLVTPLNALDSSAWGGVPRQGKERLQP